MPQKQIKKLSYEKFLESLRLCPRLTVELLIENRKKEILLLKRSSHPFINLWHLPGGFLLKGESIALCTRRVSKKEVGKALYEKDGKFVGLFETIDSDPRGHILHYVIKFKVAYTFVKPTSYNHKNFFKPLPKTIPYQKKFLNKLGYK
jgi:ADP-ribose pyrophosphatase YjhB (NUDIX family)